MKRFLAKNADKWFLLLALLVGNLADAGITDNWFPVPASNNTFLKNHQKYARMLWAFDYGHALIYEQLWRNAQAGFFFMRRPHKCPPYQRFSKKHHGQ